ncbi:hypothetical protein C7U60_02715 [Mesorhizobium plurifarium]|uniref:hypothetical protein n=1 Tax=Sinorhizobium arboris TaxID=76745 RepID=UPI00041B0389|nr:hypothetical protein [Sinorhizobium arboris]PST27214.1 hypothetical protein C7U60_02715 [Mesorhizobium plurifarium]
MSTEFSDSQHYGFFMSGTTLTSGNGFYIRWSEVVLASLRAAGFLDNMEDGTLPPSDLSKLWLDKNFDPALLKEWNPIGATWEQVTNQTLFGRVPWRGPWESSATYRRADVVSYQGRIWIAVQPSQNHAPAEDAHWDLFLESVADDAVSTAKIQAGAVTTPKIADNAVTNAKQADMATATIKGRATAGAGDPEDLTGSQAISILDPNSQVLQGEGLKLTYHKARGAWHIKAFGSSLTDVGAGNATVDTAALQSAMSSGEMIDVSGVILQANNTVVCNLESSKIGATIQSNRNAGAVSQIKVVDDALPVLFQVGHDNFEASGFSVRGNDTNVTTTMFWLERTVDTYRDIDARIVNMSLNFGARAIYHKGRGLEFFGNTISDFHTAGIEFDQPATWTPRGSTSIDGIDTGTRGVRILSNRVHVMQSPFLLNAGTYALNIGGIEVNGVMADVGCDGGLFKGVFIDMQATDIQCRFSAQAGSRIFELNPGSRNITLTNFNAAGYIGASGNRMANHAIRMTSSAANPIKDIFVIGGTIGPTLQAGVNLQGDGAYENICFSNVVWDRIGQDGGDRSPIQVSSTVPSSVIKLLGTHGRSNFTSRPFLRAFNTPANNTLIREVTSTIDASFSGWATAGVVVTT